MGGGGGGGGGRGGGGGGLPSYPLTVLRSIALSTGRSSSGAAGRQDYGQEAHGHPAQRRAVSGPCQLSLWPCVQAADELAAGCFVPTVLCRAHGRPRWRRGAGAGQLCVWRVAAASSGAKGSCRSSRSARGVGTGAVAPGRRVPACGRRASFAPARRRDRPDQLGGKGLAARPRLHRRYAGGRGFGNGGRGHRVWLGWGRFCGGVPGESPENAALTNTVRLPHVPRDSFQKTATRSSRRSAGTRSRAWTSTPRWPRNTTRSTWGCTSRRSSKRPSAECTYVGTVQEPDSHVETPVIIF